MFIHPFIKLQYSMVIVCEVNNFLKVKYRTNRTISGTVKPVLSGHSKIDKTKILMTKGSLMKSKVLQNAPLGAFCNTFLLTCINETKSATMNIFRKIFFSKNGVCKSRI